PGEHNQASDPLFAKLTDLVTNHMTISDFHLRTDSPAIDGGHNQHIPPDRTDAECADHQDGDGNTLEAVEIDFDGRPRLIDGDEDGIAVVDIGAYEATTAPLLYHVLTVTKTGNGSGQVISNKGGILCGKLCLHQYVHESTLTLMAQAEVGSTFIGWQGDCSGQSGRLNLMMSKDIHCVAQFSRDASEVPNEVIDTIASQPAEVPPCPLTGSIDFICNAQGQTATDITLEPTGNVSNVVLQGNISNQGILSNATIQPETTVNGGLLTGYVVNHGTITDFDFRGASLTGGTIGGAIENNSEIGGYFEDIRLPAGARISGGILKGNIIGVDPEHPAILEDLEISPGSYLENVIIGKNVIVDERIIQGPNVLFVDQGSHEPPPSEQPSTEAPSSEVPSTEEPPNEEPPIDDDDEPLPPPEQLNCSANATVIGNEQPKVSQTCFSGSLRTHDVERPNHIMLTHDEAKNIKISAQIQVDPSDVGQPADILIVMIHQTLTTAEDFMRVGMSDWQPWQHKNIEALQPALSYLQLPETLEVDIYQGDLSGAPKEFTAFVGYRLADQQIIYNGQDPIHFYVDRAPVPCIVYGVHDADINDTQFVHIDLSDSLTGVMKPLGPLNRDLDIEGLTLLPHIPNLVYGTSGAEAIIDGKKQGGLLYSIDRYSGELKVIGATGFDKVSALALHPLDQTLWGWGTRTGRDKWNGLIQIDPQTGQGHPVKQFEYEKKHIMEALAWQPQGQLLYAASYRTLWAYDPETQALNPICNSIGKGRIESMDAQPNGLLLLGIDQNAGMAVINVYDPEACEIVNERVFEAVDYDDLESIVWPVEECYNNSWMSRAVE
ncbi:MAG: hypothetical protein SVR94_13050, partial [Pseudomonadota bacterium]|nr:hypothetical protein [Pseudomonadota bacterium]